MKYYELDEEEVEELEAIEEALENGETDNAGSLEKRVKELSKIARSSQNKVRNINIRLSEKDLYKLKAMALKEGIPYQTLVASILHKATAS